MKFPADSVFYLQNGRARVTVVSATGNEATIMLLSDGDFVGEEPLAAIGGVRLATTTAIIACAILKTSRQEMIHVMHEEHGFSDLFSGRSGRSTLQLERNAAGPNSAPHGGFRRAGQTGTIYSQDLAGNLAEMIGNARSRVSCSMNLFRKLDFIEYNRRI